MTQLAQYVIEDTALDSYRCIWLERLLISSIFNVSRLDWREMALPHAMAHSTSLAAGRGYPT